MQQSATHCVSVNERKEEKHSTPSLCSWPKPQLSLSIPPSLQLFHRPSVSLHQWLSVYFSLDFCILFFKLHLTLPLVLVIIKWSCLITVYHSDSLVIHSLTTYTCWAWNIIWALMLYPPSQYFCFLLPFIIRSNFPLHQATSVTLLLKRFCLVFFKILHTPYPGKPNTCCAESEIIMTWLLLSMAVCHAGSFHSKIGIWLLTI